MTINLAKLKDKIVELIETLKSPSFTLLPRSAIGIYTAKPLNGTTHIGWNTPSSNTKAGDCFHFDRGVGIVKNNDAQYLWVAPHNFKSAILKADQATIVELIIKSIVPLGTEVDVLDPKHNDSAHNNSFKGTICAYKSDHVTVEDMEGNAWDLEFDEIDPIPLNKLIQGQQSVPFPYRKVVHEDCLSIIIPCTRKQADMAITALCDCTDGIALKTGMLAIDAANNVPHAKLFRELVINHPKNKNAATLSDSLEWNIKAEVLGDALLISPKTTEPNAHFLIFAQAVLHAYGIDDVYEYIIPNAGEPHNYLAEPFMLKYDSMEDCIKEMCERLVNVSNGNAPQISDQDTQNTPTDMVLNTASGERTTTYKITTYDAEGAPNGSKQLWLTQAQVQNIIDHAAQYVASSKDGDVYAELENALLVADVLSEAPSDSLSMQS